MRLYFYLDNLFLTINLAVVMLFLGALVIGTIRKNVKGILDELIELKERL
jgi:hypothetical protein